MFFTATKLMLPTPDQALPGRNEPLQLSNKHFVLGHALQPPYPENLEQIVFALGCFWGAERKFWQLQGIYSTAVGYTAGHTPNPHYEEVCSGLTGHTEAVLVIFDPEQITLLELLKNFWEVHNPTQGMRQGNDVGTQYRSGIYTANPVQQDIACLSRQHYQQQLNTAGFSAITTEILPLGKFYYAEEYHQQYLAKNPLGYCGLNGCAVSY